MGSRLKYGKGEVWAVGFGSRFTDDRMGFIGDVTPEGELVPVFDFSFALLRAVAEGKTPTIAPTTAPATRPKAQ